MFNHLAVCFNFTAVNDTSKTDSAFAGGPFMLFRRSGYEKIGSHEAAAGELFIRNRNLAALLFAPLGCRDF